MRADGYASRAGALYGPADVLAGLVHTAVITAPRLLCGQCSKLLDDADETLSCYCKDVTRDDDGIGP
jgi:hypothetical protein